LQPAVEVTAKSSASLVAARDRRIQQGDSSLGENQACRIRNDRNTLQPAVIHSCKRLPNRFLRSVADTVCLRPVLPSHANDRSSTATGNAARLFHRLLAVATSSQLLSGCDRLSKRSSIAVPKLCIRSMRCFHLVTGCS